MALPCISFGESQTLSKCHCISVDLGHFEWRHANEISIEIIDSYGYFITNITNFVASTVSADGLAPLCVTVLQARWWLSTFNISREWLNPDSTEL